MRGRTLLLQPTSPTFPGNVAIGGTLAVTGASAFSSGTFSSYVAIGTNPAAGNSLRIPTGTGISARDSGNTADIQLIASSQTTTNHIELGDAAYILDINAVTEIRLNKGQADTDVYIASDTNANHFVSDAGLFSGVGAFGFGGLVAGATDYILIQMPALTAVGGALFHRVGIGNSAAVTIPSGTSAHVSSLYVDEPNITATGTVTDAYTLILGGAPTEGTRNGALWVASGDTRIQGLIVSGTTAGLASCNSFTNLTDTTTTNAYVVGGGQAATTRNTGWIKIFTGTTAAWIPYWANATP